MIIECPDCSRKYRLDDEQAARGVQVRCTACGAVFQGGGGPDPGKPGARILVCDDAPFFRTMLDDILGSAGFTVESVDSGEAALRSIERRAPDLLILDLKLPGMSGFDVVREIRGGTSAPDLPILAMSAVYTDSSDVMDLEEVGANDYIGKKFKPEHVVKRVRRLLGGKG